VVGAGGTLYDVYDRAPLTVSTEPTPQVSPIQLVVAASRDGGQTFSRVVVDDDVHRVQSPDEASAAYIEMISAIAADPKRKGRLAVAWPYAIDESSSRILLRSTADGGKTWSKRIDVADDPIVKGKPNQHDHVASTWLADGRLVVSWRDRRS